MVITSIKQIESAMKRTIIILATILLHTLSASAQHTAKAKSHRPKSTIKAKPMAVVAPPKATILTNNYSYYNGDKGGYVFYDNGRESFQPALPVIPENTKNYKQSVPLVRGLDLDLYPQRHYPNNKLVHPDQNSN